MLNLHIYCDQHPDGCPHDCAFAPLEPDPKKRSRLGVTLTRAVRFGIGVFGVILLINTIINWDQAIRFKKMDIAEKEASDAADKKSREPAKPTPEMLAVQKIEPAIKKLEADITLVRQLQAELANAEADNEQLRQAVSTASVNGRAVFFRKKTSMPPESAAAFRDRIAQSIPSYMRSKILMDRLAKFEGDVFALTDADYQPDTIAPEDGDPRRGRTADAEIDALLEEQQAVDGFMEQPLAPEGETAEVPPAPGSPESSAEEVRTANRPRRSNAQQRARQGYQNSRPQSGQRAGQRPASSSQQRSAR